LFLTSETERECAIYNTNPATNPATARMLTALPPILMAPFPEAAVDVDDPPVEVPVPVPVP
jgi:hypothetical protein